MPKPSALVLNYPANPTALVADLDFYREVVGFAKKHDLIVLSDLAYAEIYFGGEPPPSILQVPGAMDIAVEFTTLSKTYAMPGWRMGFAVGNERLIGALTRVKSYLDYGAFTPDSGRSGGGAERPARLHRRDPRHLSPPPRLPRRCSHPLRLADPVAGGDHVRLGADPGDVLASRFARIFQDCCWSRPRSPCRPASASANMARAMCASRSSRTSSASARPRAISGNSSPKSAKSLHNVIPLASKATRTL